MENETNHKDFLATELLHELKLENERKDHQLSNLQKTLTKVIIGAMCTILLIIGGFIWYLNQYDFVSSSVATGVYAVIDSDGNVIANDLTAEDIQHCLEVVHNNGSCDENTNED